MKKLHILSLLIALGFLASCADPELRVEDNDQLDNEQVIDIDAETEAEFDQAADEAGNAIWGAVDAAGNAIGEWVDVAGEAIGDAADATGNALRNGAEAVEEVVDFEELGDGQSDETDTRDDEDFIPFNENDGDASDPR